MISTPSRRSTRCDEVLPVARSRRRAILDNRFYRNISRALSGTQEYMAMESCTNCTTAAPSS